MALDMCLIEKQFQSWKELSLLSETLSTVGKGFYGVVIWRWDLLVIQNFKVLKIIARIICRENVTFLVKSILIYSAIIRTKWVLVLWSIWTLGDNWHTTNEFLNKQHKTVALPFFNQVLIASWFFQKKVLLWQ